MIVEVNKDNIQVVHKNYGNIQPFALNHQKKKRIMEIV